MSEVVLETVGLSMRFGGVIACDRVDFRLRAGELRCLIGPNGAGKSTFFKCVTGMLRPTEGQVFMRDEETTGWPVYSISSLGVGIKTQVPSVMDGLSVFENIWLAARRHHRSTKVSDRKTRDTLERLGLEPIATSQSGQLSHGERQLVELGIVMVSEPWLIMLDEPAAGMSEDDVERLSSIVKDMTRTAAVVVVEHDMQFIRSIATTVTVFHQGAVLMEDHVSAVMADPLVRDVYLGKKDRA